MKNNFHARLVSIGLIVVLMACNSDTNSEEFQILEGDLLFQNTGNNEVANAIKSVTETSLAKNYSHVGMAMQENGQWFVLEAISKEGVCQTPLKKFLDRNKNSEGKSQTTVARLNEYYQPFFSKALEYGKERLDLPYDKIFLWNDSAYYCSELVYKMFSTQEIPQDSIPFLTNPMTFNDSTGKPLPGWVKYFKELNHEIPEGMVGTNPNLMATSPRLKFVYNYENNQLIIPQ